LNKAKEEGEEFNGEEGCDEEEQMIVT